MSRRVLYGGCALLAGILALGSCAPGALQAEHTKPKPGPKPPKTGFIERTYTDPEGTGYKYVVFIPHAYKPGGEAKYPVILFLHGRHLEGSDGWKPTTVGLGPAIKDDEENFP